jgi:hypothetical protein
VPKDEKGKLSFVLGRLNSPPQQSTRGTAAGDHDLEDTILNIWETENWDDENFELSDSSDSEDLDESLETFESLDSMDHVPPTTSWLQGDRHRMLVVDGFLYWRKRNNKGTKSKQPRQVYACKDRMTCGCTSKVVMRDDAYVSSNIIHHHDDHQLEIELIKIRHAVKDLAALRPDVRYL